MMLKTGWITAITAMALAVSTSAFLPQPAPSTTSLQFHSTSIYQPLLKNANHGSRSELFFSQNDDGHHDLQEDWKTLTKAAGDIARNLGGKLVNAIREGGNKLKDLATQGAEKVKSALTKEEPKTTIHVDTQDEDLFRSLLGDEGLFVAPTEPSLLSVYPIMDQAAFLLAKDETVATLLGPSLRYGKPFSQSTWSTSVNGRSTTVLRASFEVWGSQGQGVASVSSTDGSLTSLDLQVQGLQYSLNTNPGTTKTQPSFDKEDDGAIEVEVLEGIRIPGGRRRASVLDAEILEKTLW